VVATWSHLESPLQLLVALGPCSWEDSCICEPQFSELLNGEASDCSTHLPGAVVRINWMVGDKHSK
jgi:hypothetical protein